MGTDAPDELFVVRLYDGFDHEWMDIGDPMSKAEAENLLAEKTEGGKKSTSYADIDYYAIFPADTTMVFSEKGKREVFGMTEGGP